MFENRKSHTFRFGGTNLIIYESTFEILRGLWWLALVCIQRDQTEDKANGSYHFCYSWSLLIYHPIGPHNSKQTYSKMKQKALPQNEIHTHSHIMGSVMDRGGLETAMFCISVLKHYYLVSLLCWHLSQSFSLFSVHKLPSLLSFSIQVTLILILIGKQGHTSLNLMFC